MLHLWRKQIITFFLGILTALTAHAQRELNRPDHDNLRYYFGLTFGYNNASLHTSKDPRFLQYDSVLTVEPGASGGFSLGLLGTFRLTDRLELRAAPQLIVGGSKFFTYTLRYPMPGEPAVITKTLPSTIVSFPFHVKFNSDRIDNFRIYLLGGFKYDIDLASNSAARNAEDLVKLKKFDFGIEGGIGFNFYMKFVTFSPEIKISNGLTNIHSRDPNLKFSNVLGDLKSTMIVFSINLED